MVPKELYYNVFAVLCQIHGYPSALGFYFSDIEGHPERRKLFSSAFSISPSSSVRTNVQEARHIEFNA